MVQPFNETGASRPTHDLDEQEPQRESVEDVAEEGEDEGEAAVALAVDDGEVREGREATQAGEARRGPVGGCDVDAEVREGGAEHGRVPVGRVATGGAEEVVLAQARQGDGRPWLVRHEGGQGEPAGEAGEARVGTGGEDATDGGERPWGEDAEVLEVAGEEVGGFGGYRAGEGA